MRGTPCNTTLRHRRRDPNLLLAGGRAAAPSLQPGRLRGILRAKRLESGSSPRTSYAHCPTLGPPTGHCVLAYGSRPVHPGGQPGHNRFRRPSTWVENSWMAGVRRSMAACAALIPSAIAVSLRMASMVPESFPGLIEELGVVMLRMRASEPRRISPNLSAAPRPRVFRFRKRDKTFDFRMSRDAPGHGLFTLTLPDPAGRRE